MRSSLTRALVKVARSQSIRSVHRHNKPIAKVETPTTNTIRPIHSCCHHTFPHHHHTHEEHETPRKKDNHHDPKPNVPDTDYAYEIKANHFKYGPGVLKELGMDVVKVLKDQRVDRERPRIAIYTDAGVQKLELFETALASVKRFNPKAQILIYGTVEVEPTDQSYLEAIQFAKEHGPIDMYISIGGGSVMDTTKAVNLYT
jgi:hydroxyacid-oxoacid transhydrogenase